MSKSTPLNQLPNMQQNLPQNMQQNTENQQSNDKESQLVNDILNEIENGENKGNEMDQNIAMEQQMQQQMQQQMDQQMQQQMQQPIEQPSFEESPLNIPEDQSIQHNNSMEPVHEKSLVDKITDMIKQPAIVAAICIFMSIPKLNTMIVSILPKKEFILNNSNLFVTIIKGLVAGILFYALNITL